VKVADFGLAKLTGRSPDEFSLTEARQAMGTPGYMAPEQLERPLEVDHRADVYSLGVVLYEMLTGELPLGRFASPSNKVQVDIRLDEVVLRALEKEPERRYQQVSEFKTVVETVATKLGSSPPEPDAVRESETSQPADVTTTAAGRTNQEMEKSDMTTAQISVDDNRTSGLAIASLILSCLTVILGPFGCIPGIICGHLARAKCRKDPALKGAGMASAGLIVGYTLLAVGLLATFVIFALTGTPDGT
jgi:serine/threonine protein kinase